MSAHVVVIARGDQTAGLRKRLGTDPAVVLFSDSESLKALDAILARPPKILALDRAFAATARGAALVARMRAEDHSRAIDIRVLAEDEMNLPVIISTRTPGLEGAVLKASHPLDYCGTRRAPRFPIGDAANIVVNGERGRLVNLSTTGAQVLMTLRLRPEEPLRISLVDASAEVRVRGVVAWSAAEPNGSLVTYRAGIEFVNQDALSVEAFCVRHIGGADAR